MALDDKHPEYTKRLPQWSIVNDCYEGEDAVKAKGTDYLPATSGMYAQGFGNAQNDTNAPGWKMYTAYQLRAEFPEVYREAIVSMVGVMHRNEPTINVPPELEPMLKEITPDGETAQQLMRKMTTAQLKEGRCGLLVDVPDGATIDKAVPYLAFYDAASIINWDPGRRQRGQAKRKLELVVLDETEQERQADFSWKEVKQLRVLALAGAVETLSADDQTPIAEGEYVTLEVRDDGTNSAFDSANLATAPWVAPSIAGNRLQEIPFVFLNVNDLTPNTDVPPLYGLAKKALVMYRGSADYRQNLFMQGQDTLVRTGIEGDPPPAPVGAGAVQNLPTNADAKYIGISGEGIAEQRLALENDRKEAALFTVQFIDQSGGEDQSGAALRVRVTARTSTLATVQLANATALRDALIFSGEWMGLPQAKLDDIEVIPNYEFAAPATTPADVKSLQDAKVAGAPISEESMHAYLKKAGYVVFEFEVEKEKLRGEASELGMNGKTGTEQDPGQVDPAQPKQPMQKRLDARRTQKTQKTTKTTKG